MLRKIFFCWLLACLLLTPGGIQAQNETIHRAWGQVFGRADTTDDFLIYDATIPDFDTTLIYIAGKTRNGNAFPLKEKQGAFFHEKDDMTDAFLACFSIYGQLLWSTWLPAAENGYINGFASCVRSVTDSTFIVVCNDYDYTAIDLPIEDFRNTIPIARGKLNLLEFHKDGHLLQQKAFITRPSAFPPRIFDIYLSSIDTITPLKLAGHLLYPMTVSNPIFSISDGCWYSLSSDWEEQTISTPTFRNCCDAYSSAYYTRSPVFVNFIHFEKEQNYQAISVNVGKGILYVGYYNGNICISGPQCVLAPAARYDLNSHFTELWKIHNEDTGNGYQYQASPLLNRWVINIWTFGYPTFSGTVQNTQKFNNHYIVQGVHCKNYRNGFFRSGDSLYAYSHDETNIFVDSQSQRNPHYTAVPFLYIYDQSFTKPTDSTRPIYGTFLDMDWYFEDFFFRTDLSRPKNLFMPYDPMLLTSGNRFFLIGNVRKIGEDVLTSGSSDTSAHHQGIILSFFMDCPPERTAFDDVRFLCPGDSVELRMPTEYTGFTLRFDPSVADNASVLLNPDSSRAWVRQEGIYRAVLDGSAIGCPDASVDSVRISLSPYPEPVSALPEDTTVSCAAFRPLLQAVPLPDTSFSYRWYDGDTNWQKPCGFNGDSLQPVSVTVNSYCTSFTDSAFIRFLPPFVDLGNDTLICHTGMPADTALLLHLDANQDYFPAADWIFRWLVNGHEAGHGDSLLLRFSDLDSVAPSHYQAIASVSVALSDTATEGCTASDTISLDLFVLPDTEGNIFLPKDSILCAHLDLNLELPDKATNYHCFWQDIAGIVLPFGNDTNRFTVGGLRGTDGFGANTDSRNPRFFQLRLDHKICGVSFFDTLLVYDQVRPAFELPFHDTVVCLDEPVVLDSLNPFVYRPFYAFEWNDGKTGSDYSFADSGTYILRFFVREDFNICGYEAASDTLRVKWSDPAMTLITLPEDTSFCERLSVTLDASVPFPATRYSWQEGSFDDLVPPSEDSTLFISPVIKVDKETSYALFLLDTLGCLNTKQINIHEEDCKPRLEIPNVFTPNGDGVNDVWKFTQLEKCYQMDIIVVDRKGSHVLHEKVGNADDFSWNGCYRNGSRKMPDGPYFYMVSYKDAYGKKKTQSGSVTILGTAE